MDSRAQHLSTLHLSLIDLTSERIPRRFRASLWLRLTKSLRRVMFVYLTIYRVLYMFSARIFSACFKYHEKFVKDGN